MTTILVIEDEPQIRRFIHISLVAEGFEVLEAASLQQASEIMKTQHADLVVLDLGLPDGDGYDVLCDIRSRSTVPVLVLTARNEEDEKIKLLEGGANDYLSKPFGVRELVVRIRVLLRDFANIEKLTIQRMTFDELIIDVSAHEAWLKGRRVALSRKEFNLLCCLAQHAGELVTQQHLLKTVWGHTHTDDTHYLRIFISHLRKKLGDDAGAPRYIETEPGVGYRFLTRAQLDG